MRNPFAATGLVPVGGFLFIVDQSQMTDAVPSGKRAQSVAFLMALGLHQANYSATVIRRLDQDKLSSCRVDSKRYHPIAYVNLSFNVACIFQTSKHLLFSNALHFYLKFKCERNTRRPLRAVIELPYSAAVLSGVRSDRTCSTASNGPV